MSIEQVVLEFVLVTPEAAIAGTVAVVWATLKDFQRPLENTQPEAANPLREPRTASQSVIKVQLRLSAIPTSLSARRATLVAGLSPAGPSRSGKS